MIGRMKSTVKFVIGRMKSTSLIVYLYIFDYPACCKILRNFQLVLTSKFAVTPARCTLTAAQMTFTVCHVPLTGATGFETVLRAKMKTR